MPSAIVLAGGLGTRLASISQGHPKPMMDVAGRPFLEYVLDTLVDACVEKAILAVSYRWQVLRDHFRSRYRSMAIEYSVENEPLGTGGAIRKCVVEQDLQQALILNGDTLLKIDLRDLVDQHNRQHALITMALRRVEDTSRYGTVTCDSRGIVSGFASGGDGKPGMINGGTYVIQRRALDDMELPEKFSFERDFLEKQVSRLHPLGIQARSYFIDIGVPEDLQRAQADLAK